MTHNEWAENQTIPASNNGEARAQGIREEREAICAMIEERMKIWGSDGGVTSRSHHAEAAAIFAAIRRRGEKA